jgi:hypothetical protein
VSFFQALSIKKHNFAVIKYGETSFLPVIPYRRQSYGRSAEGWPKGERYSIKEI